MSKKMERADYELLNLVKLDAFDKALFNACEVIELRRNACDAGRASFEYLKAERVIDDQGLLGPKSRKALQAMIATKRKTQTRDRQQKAAPVAQAPQPVKRRHVPNQFFAKAAQQAAAIVEAQAKPLTEAEKLQANVLKMAQDKCQDGTVPPELRAKLFANLKERDYSA